MKTAPKTLAQALDVIRVMHNALLAFRNPEFDLIAPGREGDFDDRVKAVLAHSAPVIMADSNAAAPLDLPVIAALDANPVVVDAHANADDMNSLHGECYGRDWFYPVIGPGPDSLEREIQAKADKGPRVTPAALQAEIASAHYFTGFDGAAGAAYNKASPDGVLREFCFEAPPALSLLTFCVLVLRNGFTVHGVSDCASPENYNKEIGERIARENAEREIWPLLGFRLRDELARPVLTEADALADLAGEPRPS